jgi:hypothetical protein
MYPKLYVIIPTYNRPQLLLRTLHLLRAGPRLSMVVAEGSEVSIASANADICRGLGDNISYFHIPNADNGAVEPNARRRGQIVECNDCSSRAAKGAACASVPYSRRNEISYLHDRCIRCDQFHVPIRWHLQQIQEVWRQQESEFDAMIEVPSAIFMKPVDQL